LLSQPVGVLPAGFFFFGLGACDHTFLLAAGPEASSARVRAARMPSSRRQHPPEDAEMAKGLDKKKEQKKKPAKTLKEKRADKQEKKGAR